MGEGEIKKPLSGLLPEKLHTERRFAEVCGAITKYCNSNQKIPIGWVKEYNQLIEKLEL